MRLPFFGRKKRQPAERVERTAIKKPDYPANLGLGKTAEITVGGVPVKVQRTSGDVLTVLEISGVKPRTFTPAELGLIEKKMQPGVMQQWLIKELRFSAEKPKRNE